MPPEAFGVGPPKERLPIPSNQSAPATAVDMPEPKHGFEPSPQTQAYRSASLEVEQCSLRRLDDQITRIPEIR